MNRDRKGPMDDGTSHPQLADPWPHNDMATSGVHYDGKVTNPYATQGAGRPDGTANTDMDDSDGFDHEDTYVAGSWGGGLSANPVNRGGGTEIRGQLERGFVLNQAAAGVTAPCITDPGVNPGGKIGPA